jgi:hypothetical protein
MFRATDVVDQIGYDGDATCSVHQRGFTEPKNDVPESAATATAGGKCRLVAGVSIPRALRADPPVSR